MGTTIAREAVIISNNLLHLIPNKKIHYIYRTTYLLFKFYRLLYCYNIYNINLTCTFLTNKLDLMNSKLYDLNKALKELEIRTNNSDQDR